MLDVHAAWSATLCCGPSGTKRISPKAASVGTEKSAGTKSVDGMQHLLSVVTGAHFRPENKRVPLQPGKEDGMTDEPSPTEYQPDVTYAFTPDDDLVKVMRANSVVEAQAIASELRDAGLPAAVYGDA